MINYLGKQVNVVIDRAINTKHPKDDTIYKLNYGYLPNTLAPDGKEIDAYVVGVYEPIKQIEGMVIAIIKRKNDIEDKLVVKPLNIKQDFDKEQIKELTHFQEQYFDIDIIM